MHILLPKKLIPERLITGSLFFLAGPIRGGGNWQQKACLLIERYTPNATVAVPCRWNEADLLYDQRIVPGIKDYEFLNQTLWERHYLAKAARRGVIIFWLPLESKFNPRGEDGPYARDTLGELGRWVMYKHFRPKTRLVIGAEAGFSGLKQIKTNLIADLHSDVLIHSTLEEVISEAMDIAP